MNEAPRRRWTFVILGLLVLALVGLAVLRVTVFQPLIDQSKLDEGNQAVLFERVKQANQELEAHDKQKADKEAILKVLSDQDAAWNRGDLEGFMEGYWNSPGLTFYSGSDPRKGWDETLRRYRKKYQGAEEGRITSQQFTALMMERYRQQYPGPDTEMGKLTFSDLDIELLGPDSALVRGRWRLSWSKQPVGGLFTLIMKRTPDGWRIVHDHTS